MDVLHYLSESGQDLYQDWLDGLKDLRARVAFNGGWTGWLPATMAIMNSAGTGYGNCAFTSGPAIACITRKKGG